MADPFADQPPVAHNPSNLPIFALQYAQQSSKLSVESIKPDGSNLGQSVVRAEFTTPHDPVLRTANGGRIPGATRAEGERLNALRKEVQRNAATYEEEDDGEYYELKGAMSTATVGLAPAAHDHINPVFPPLAQYGPLTPLWKLQILLRQIMAILFQLVLFFPLVFAIAGFAMVSLYKNIRHRIAVGDPDLQRPFIQLERERAAQRKQEEADWIARGGTGVDVERMAGQHGKYVPTAGGPDELNWNNKYYARRVGLDAEEYRVQTEDGFIISLWHIFDPNDYIPLDSALRNFNGPEVERPPLNPHPRREIRGDRKPKYPVLIMHGLMQSSGAFACNDDNSYAFWLCKSGYDVWLGDNRCGFKPEHVSLGPNDPRFWNWNIRHMGVFDDPALISRVLWETGFEKLAYIGHSQGCTQIMMGLAKDQRPEIGECLSVFCGLAPAAYSGPLLDRFYFRLCRQITTQAWQYCFGMHSFIPTMGILHRNSPKFLYGLGGYQVFSLLFGWSNDRWDRGLLSRMFMCAPSYISSESLRWWLGTEGFATNTCLLSTKATVDQEDADDARLDGQNSVSDDMPEELAKARSEAAWYNEQSPPFALWMGGQDNIVDGPRLLRRFQNGREPHVKLVHQNILQDYNHLDLIWALDGIDRVAAEMRDVIWKTCEVRSEVRVPFGCEGIAF